MRITASVVLIWQVAAAEANAGDFSDIHPEHFWMGLLKLSEVSTERIKELAAEGQNAAALAMEIKALRAALVQSEINPTQARRTLRVNLGKGGTRHTGGLIHRSARSRKLFEVAANFAAEAGTDALASPHLLAALLRMSDVALTQILRGASASPNPAPDTPMLDRFGIDLLGFSPREEFHADDRRMPQCKAILQVLARGKHVFLVTDTEDAAHSILTLLAGFLLASNPSGPGPDQRRLIQISWGSSGFEEALPATLDQWYDEMLCEAARSPNVILVCAASDVFPSANQHKTQESCQAPRFDHTEACCIIPIRARHYEAVLKTNRKWRRLADPVWVVEIPKSIPKEL
jgi:hypothetical protein